MFSGFVDGVADVNAEDLDAYLKQFRQGLQDIFSKHAAHIGKMVWEVGHNTVHDYTSTAEDRSCSYRVILSGAFERMPSDDAARMEHELLIDLHIFFSGQVDLVRNSNFTTTYAGTHTLDEAGLEGMANKVQSYVDLGLAQTDEAKAEAAKEQ